MKWNESRPTIDGARHLHYSSLLTCTIDDDIYTTVGLLTCTSCSCSSLSVGRLRAAMPAMTTNTCHSQEDTDDVMCQQWGLCSGRGEAATQVCFYQTSSESQLTSPILVNVTRQSLQQHSIALDSVSVAAHWLLNVADSIINMKYFLFSQSKQANEWA